jgi:hypothetical protein
MSADNKTGGEKRIESDSISDFARIGNSDLPKPQSLHAATQLDLDPDKVQNGLGQIVLTLVKLLHELLERQAIRRMDGGSLTEEEIERLGIALMKQSEEIERLRKEFGLEEEDLNIDLGPLGKLL